MDKSEQKLVIESLLFTSEVPLTLKKLQELFPETGQKELRQLLNEMTEEYKNLGRSFYLREVANGYQLCTKTEYAEWVRKLHRSKPFRFGRATMETLAIIAYKQPLTRAGIEDIRGVDVGGILRGLLERRIIKIIGKKDVPGKPLLYGTTSKFLTLFGLRSLKDLPALEDIERFSDTMEPLFAELPLRYSEGDPESEASSGPSTGEEPSPSTAEAEAPPPDNIVQ